MIKIIIAYVVTFLSLIAGMLYIMPQEANTKSIETICSEYTEMKHELSDDKTQWVDFYNYCFNTLNG